VASAKKCDEGQVIYGSCGLLLKIHKGVFKYCKPNHFIAKERSEIRVDSKCDESFQQLKIILTSAPILRIET
jgi:hypothetical protein